MPRRHNPTDFFDRQDLARRNTMRLLSLFTAVILFLIAGNYLVIMLFVDATSFFFGVEEYVLLGPLLFDDSELIFRPELLIAAIASTLVVILVGVFIKYSELREGGPAVAEAFGAVATDPSSPDPLVRRFVNIVEEMSLASGVPVPRTYVLHQQRAINAFAAGHTINDAAITVTKGALRHLTRDELQGVIAHEFSHILHGDMRLNIRLIGLLHGILGIYLGGVAFCRAGLPSDSEDLENFHPFALALLIPGVILAIVGFGGLIGSRFIKGGIARQREYLADASAIQFTRNPEGLAGALKKVGGYSRGSRLRDSNAEMVSHMCFGEASSSWFTHPPLEDRLQALDPNFNPDLGFLVFEDDEEHAELHAPGSDGTASAPHSNSPGAMGDFAGDLANIGDLDADDIIAAIGQTSPEMLVYCATLLQLIPRPLLDARSNLAGAVATAYLLLIDEDDKEMRRAQAQIIQQETSSSIASEAQRLWPMIRHLDEQLRLPLMDLLIPMLRQMTEDQFLEFSAVAERIIRVDDSTSFREFVLERVVLHHLEITFSDDQRRSVQYHSFSGVSRDLEYVLSALAYAASDDIKVVGASFTEGRRHLPERVQPNIHLIDRDRWTFELVASSLERLSVASPSIKKAIIKACAHCVMADGIIVTSEVEMLRAICEILDLPLPPFIPRQTQKSPALA